MSRKIHVGPEGQIGICSAFRGKCPYEAEGSYNHFDNPKEAYAYAEKVVENSTPEHQKLISMNKKAMKKVIKNADKASKLYEDDQMRRLGPRGDGWHDPIDVDEIPLGRRFKNFFWSTKDSEGAGTRAFVFASVAMVATLLVVKKMSGVPMDVATSLIPDGMGYALAAGTLSAIGSGFYGFIHNGFRREWTARGFSDRADKARDEITQVHEDLEKFKKRSKTEIT